MNKVKKELTLNFIQDLATPHNNVLIKELLDSKKFNLQLWYAENSDETYGLYNWKKDITNEHAKAKIYGKQVNLKFLSRCLFSNDICLVVGWMNINTRLLIIFFFLTRKKYYFWTDAPPKNKKTNFIRDCLREIFFFMLRNSNNIIFCAGTFAIDSMKKRGFRNNRLKNLPIFIEVGENVDHYKRDNGNIRKKYGLKKDEVMIVLASRFTYEKGFDLLIKSLKHIDINLKNQIKVLIIGDGKEKTFLNKLINESKFKDEIILENWIDPNELKSIICNSDILINPARFDAYGSASLGMSLGTAVIASNNCGAALDRIIHMKNGIIYNTYDLESLASHISNLVTNKNLREDLANEAYETSKEWPPALGRKIIEQKVAR